MRSLLLVVLLVVAVWMLVRILRANPAGGQTTAPQTVRRSVADVPAIVAGFESAQPGIGSFLVVVTDLVGSDGETAAPQISVESDGIGVDHLLSVEVNRGLEARFRELMRRLAIDVVEKRQHDMAYLRAVTDDPGTVLQAVLETVYDMAPNQPIVVFDEVVSSRPSVGGPGS